jgi:hypothetical protein
MQETRLRVGTGIRRLPARHLPWAETKAFVTSVGCPEPAVALVARCETDVVYGAGTCICVGACTGSS